jgi:hypothetical protein
MAEQTGALYRSYSGIEVGGQSRPVTPDRVDLDMLVTATRYCLHEAARSGCH